MIWLFLNLAFATEMLEASKGIIGREIQTIPFAVEAYEKVAMEDWAACAEHFKSRADLFDSHRNDALIWSVVCHIRNEDLKSAYSVLGELIVVAEDVGWPLLIIESWLLLELGGNKAVIKLLRDYPEKESDHIGAIILQMRAYRSLERHRRVRKLKDSMLQSGQSDAWFWSDLATRAPASERNFFLERSLRAPRASVYHYMAMLNFHEEQENLSLVLKYGLEGMNQFPQQNKIKYRMLRFASSAEGRELLQQKVIDFPEHSKAQALLGLSLLAEKKYTPAAKHLNIAIQQGEKQVLMYEALGEALILNGEHERIWKILDEAVKEHPNSEKLWRYFSQSSITVEQQRVFVRKLNVAWKDGVYHSVDLIQQAFQYSRAIEETDLALLWAERELSVAGASWKAWSRKAMALYDVNRFDESVNCYESALQLDPDNSFVLNNLAWLLISRSDENILDAQRALVLIQKAIENSAKPVAGYYDTLAAVNWVLGRPKEALEAQGKAIEVDPSKEKYQDRYRKYQLSGQ